MTDATADAGSVPLGWRRAPRWVLAALVGSLAVNLLVLGLGFGAAWHVRSGQALGGGNLLGNLSAFSQTLPAERRSQLAPLIADPRQQPELRAQRQEVRMARREVLRLFTADPFDVAAFRAAEARASAVETGTRKAAGRQRAELDDERSGKGRPPKSP
jgi:uncharacterized membrane protein